ncbi:TPA: type VI secretion system Vgr family protein [Providencia alcalifaciens]
MALLDNLNINQRQHFLRWEGDIAKELLLVSIEGKESLSSPYKYQLTSLTTKQESALQRWLGTPVACHIGGDTSDSPSRFLHGVITHIHYVPRTATEAKCILTIEPSLALLKMGRMMRIWKGMSVPELVQALLSEKGMVKCRVQLRDNYAKREYYVQYRESAFDFMHRLLEEEGIYYYFQHTISEHILVLVDHPASHPVIQTKSLFWHHHGRVLTQGNIDNWAASSTLSPSKVVLRGTNMPQATAIEAQQNASLTSSTMDGIIFTDITPSGERDQITREARKTLVAEEVNTQQFDATVNAYWLCCGETFSLIGHPSGDKTYCIKAMTFSATNNFDRHSSDYQCQLQVIYPDRPWQSPIRSPVPEIPGVLTAIVVGPASEDIHTDEYGRIKIQFPWDKESSHDDSSSCWVRVAQSWAGGRFGSQFIPRVGSEVLVSFVQGHPDYPLVIGSVYNGQNKPPFNLPEEKTESGFLSRSSKGCVDDGNRLSFNDKKGEERLTMIAQRDLHLTVKNDAMTTIVANRSTELTKGNDQLRLREGGMNIDLDRGNYVVHVAGESDFQTQKALTFESKQSIKMIVGNNTIMLSAEGISINGARLSLSSSGSAELKGTSTQVIGTTLTTIDGQLIKIG